jgi:beta-lactamase class A
MGRARHRRRRQRRQRPNNVALKRSAATAIILVSAAGFAIETGRDSYSAPRPHSSTTVAGATTTTTSTTLPTTTTTVPVAHRLEDPFHSAALSTYLRTRTDNVTAALYNVTTHQTYIYRPGVQQVTASMAKIDILAVLLWESQLHHRSLTAKEQSLATAMIEQSDNMAAESLWVDIGQLPSVTEFNDDLHFSQTVTNWDWGFIDTTPRDQLQLLKAIVLPNQYLDPASRQYEQNLMENVADYERFGIPTGVPTNAMVGVKNGWYPEKTTGWQVNSAGYVRLGRTFYLAVVMTGSNPSEAYGREVVNRVAQAFWHFESDRANWPS